MKINAPSSVKTYAQVLLMLMGAVVIIYVFANNRQSLPIDVGSSDTGGTGASLTLPIAASQSNPLEEGSASSFASDISESTNDVVIPAPAEISSLPDNNSGEAGSVSTLTKLNNTSIQIPDPESQLTILMAGTVLGCTSCAIEVQTLSQIQNEYGADTVHVIFVEIYNGSPEFVSQFASLLGATNLTWTIDYDGSFREAYEVDLDSTVIMDSQGNILFRDNTITAYETFQEQIEVALAR